MNNSKKRALLGFLLLIISGWVAIMWLDWSRLFSFSTTGQTEEFFLSRCIKLALSFTISLLVWSTGRARLSERDGKMLSIIFLVFFIADVSFFLDNYPVGIGAFTIAQVFFIFRNTPGISKIARKKSSGGKPLQLTLIAVAIATINCTILFFVFVPHAANPMFPIITGYSFFLCCSLFIGLATYHTRHFPTVNTRLIMMGVSLLYFGDLTVGLNIILPHTRGYIISTSLTWFFYLPALTLFALSGYQLKQQLPPDDEQVRLVPTGTLFKTDS